jgi:hypothetical protein
VFGSALPLLFYFLLCSSLEDLRDTAHPAALKTQRALGLRTSELRGASSAEGERSPGDILIPQSEARGLNFVLWWLLCQNDNLLKAKYKERIRKKVPGLKALIILVLPHVEIQEARPQRTRE